MNQTTVSLDLLLIGLLLAAAVIVGIAIITRHTDNPTPEPDDPGLAMETHVDDAITLAAFHSQLFTDAEVAELRRLAASDHQGVA